MIDKLGPPIAKAFAPIINVIGKNHLKNEKVLGVVFRDKYIQVAEISLKKKQYKIENFSNQQISGIGDDQDIFISNNII